MRWWGRRGAFLGLDPSRSPCRPRVRRNVCVEGLADAPRKHRFVPGGEVGAVATEDAGRDGETFLLAMRGTGVSLSGLPAREWMDVLDRLLAAIEASASWHGQGGQGRFAVTALREGSVEPVIAALDAYAGPRLRGFVAEMKAGEEHRFLGRERDAAEAIARFAEKYRGELAVIDASNNEPLAILGAEVRPHHREYKELAVVYGKAFRVGGKMDEATIHVEMEPSGATLVCNASREVTRRAAQRLWEPIALRGLATWNVDTREMERFIVDDIVPYDPVAPAKAFAELRCAAGPDSWGDDPVAAIVEFRRGGDGV